MSEVAIRAEGLSKTFRIYDHPGDRLREAFSLKRVKFHTDFQALNNLSFEVKKGEFLGIVGKNGAGKSTLLKILSRELTPTSGSVTIHGTVSLLQLGVGFDPELTGIENARFASKLLGYSDIEVENLLEEIIAFADIGEFIKHPVKTYSSGMHSRLSFAVGININPDILIADEVLSVGDMRFSQKCLRKMRDFKERGKTVIFVSHDVQSVNVFCDTAMWLKDGEIFLRGDAKKVTTSFQNYMLYDKLPSEYDSLDERALDEDREADIRSASPIECLSSNEGNIEWTSLEHFPSVGDGRAEIKRLSFVRADTFAMASVLSGTEDLVLILDIVARARMKGPQIGFVIYNRQGLPAIHTNNDICGNPLDSLGPGQRLRAVFRFKLPALANGSYIFSVGVQTGLNMAHKVDDAFEFEVSRGDMKATQCGYVILESESFELVCA